MFRKLFMKLQLCEEQKFLLCCEVKCRGCVRRLVGSQGGFAWSSQPGLKSSAQLYGSTPNSVQVPEILANQLLGHRLCYSHKRG